MNDLMLWHPGIDGIEACQQIRKLLIARKVLLPFQCTGEDLSQMNGLNATLLL